MLDHEDLKWIASASTELNSMLQQISRYSGLARQHKGEYKYVEMLGDRVEFASRKSQELFVHVTSKILAETAGASKTAKQAHPAFAVVPYPTEPGREALKTVLGHSKSKAAPLKSVRAGALAPIPPDIHILNAQGNRELILVVDDETEISEFASGILADGGYKVVLAKDGFEALRIYQQIGPQIGLVVLDFFLPVMDGDAVFDELRTLNPNVDVVLNSGLAEQSKSGAMLAQGLRGFIPKPYTREKLLEQVRSILAAPSPASALKLR
ncbi:MAG: response regulator [Chthoniobacterales bacterium]|nr:response regulator [Chthoniobacterales bacterium]